MYPLLLNNPIKIKKLKFSPQANVSIIIYKLSIFIIVFNLDWQADKLKFYSEPDGKK